MVTSHRERTHTKRVIKAEESSSLLMLCPPRLSLLRWRAFSSGPANLLAGLGVAEPDSKTLVLLDHVGVVGCPQGPVCLQEGVPATVSKTDFVVVKKLENFENVVHF